MKKTENSVKMLANSSVRLEVENAINDMLDRLLFSVITENNRLKAENSRLKKVVKTACKDRGFFKIS
ncbi:MAG: hypothetical protein IKJ14_07195 [Clostridia bacterium]|nr:hypothetical protein [Clostridia bacterium]